jgi:hypothetical protein
MAATSAVRATWSDIIANENPVASANSIQARGVVFAELGVDAGGEDVAVSDDERAEGQLTGGRVLDCELDRPSEEVGFAVVVQR